MLLTPHKASIDKSKLHVVHTVVVLMERHTWMWVGGLQSGNLVIISLVPIPSYYPLTSQLLCGHS